MGSIMICYPLYFKLPVASRTRTCDVMSTKAGAPLKMMYLFNHTEDWKFSWLFLNPRILLHLVILLLF